MFLGKSCYEEVFRGRGLRFGYMNGALRRGVVVTVREGNVGFEDQTGLDLGSNSM